MKYFIIILIILLFPVLAKLITAQSLAEKIMLTNIFTSIGALIICMIGISQNNNYIIDIVLIYFLYGFVATLGYGKYCLRQDQKSHDK